MIGVAPGALSCKISALHWVMDPCCHFLQTLCAPLLYKHSHIISGSTHFIKLAQLRDSVKEFFWLNLEQSSISFLLLALLNLDRICFCTSFALALPCIKGLILSKSLPNICCNLPMLRKNEVNFVKNQSYALQSIS